jgi:hypothetical protein
VEVTADISRIRIRISWRGHSSFFSCKDLTAERKGVEAWNNDKEER